MVQQGAHSTDGYIHNDIARDAQSNAPEFPPSLGRARFVQQVELHQLLEGLGP
jgi:hypothetical protein